MWSAKMPRLSRQSRAFAGINVGRSLNSGRLKQSRARSADRARQAADVSARAALALPTSQPRRNGAATPVSCRRPHRRSKRLFGGNCSDSILFVAGGTESSQTLRWRKPDSNPRSPVYGESVASSRRGERRRSIIMDAKRTVPFVRTSGSNPGFLRQGDIDFAVLEWIDVVWLPACD